MIPALLIAFLSLVLPTATTSTTTTTTAAPPAATASPAPVTTDGGIPHCTDSVEPLCI